jgi:hypothetical protein
METVRIENVRNGVIAKLKSTGKYTGKFVRTNKICQKCGDIYKPHRSTQKYCSKKCSRKYTDLERKKNVTKRVSEWRRRTKIKLVTMFGGKCIRCGYSKCIAALEFHHTDPSKKEFGLSVRGLTRFFDKLVEEAKKCELICANCHAEEHFKKGK